MLVFLGIPLAAGYLSRRIGEATRGRDWYETTFLPRVGPFALWGLLFTIVMLFALQGQQVIDNPLDVGRIALPLLAYFALTFFAGFLIATARPLGRPLTGLLLTTEWATSATDSVGDSVE